LIALFLLLASGLPTPAELRALFDQLGAVAGMPPKRPVRVEQMNRAQLNAYLRQRVRETAKPDQIRDEELTLKALGLVPDDFELERSTVDLLTEQAAAFYDYRKRRLVLLENPIGEYDRDVLVHELAHALADQYFRIGRFMDQAAKTDDGTLARQAVVEGQASWLALEWRNRQEGRASLREDDSPMPGESSLDVSSGAAFPVLQKSPLYLRVSLLFPYWEGGRFQQAVVKRLGGEGLRRVFTQPPVSSRQILHPEAYFARETPDEAPLPDAPGKGWKPFARGTLGEIDHLVMFRLVNATDGAAVASDWRGSVYEVARSKTECCRVRYASRWATEAGAARAAELIRAHLGRKLNPGALTIERRGRDVLAIELPARREAIVMRQSPKQFGSMDLPPQSHSKISPNLH
jgi:hypothetical protein